MVKKYIIQLKLDGASENEVLSLKDTINKFMKNKEKVLVLNLLPTDELNIIQINGNEILELIKPEDKTGWFKRFFSKKQDG
jgi:ABC-type antimicrobial peptide transport system permease subunit